ncbi:MAG: acyltransferase [Devosia sp.]
MSDNRLAGADFVRALACLMVLGHHMAQRLDPNALGRAGANTATVVTMGAFGVGAFFVLSGYLLARPFWLALDAGQPMPSIRTYILRRAARILPGFYLALTVAFFLSFTILQAKFDLSLVLRFLAGVFLVADLHWSTWFPVEINAPLWSIGCEITSYVLLPIGLLAIFKLPMARGWLARLVWVGIIALVVGAQFLALRYLQPDELRRSWNYGLVGGAKVWWPNYNPIGFFAIFAIGALAAGIQTRLPAARNLAFDLLALGGFALAIYGIAIHYPTAEGQGLGNIPYGYPWFPMGIGLVLIAVPNSGLLSRITEIAPIRYIARVSFGVYVWHYFLMETIRILWQPRYVYFGMRDVVQWGWISAIVLVLSFVIATLSYRFLEEPIIRWARGLERRPIPASPTLSPAAG